ncbi:MAG TPA: hypothetical protein VH592_01180 [Gemmataceae bacterium]|jgi:hypothetical protein
MFRSRWGFHPCDFQTYCKLKILNQVFSQAIRLAHAWERWQRKAPHNRVLRRRIRNEKGQAIGYESPIPLPEPRICPVFSQKIFEQCHVSRQGNLSREGFQEEKVVTEDCWIVADYASARKPAPDPSMVQPLHHTAAEREELYQRARTWLEERDVK